MRRLRCAACATTVNADRRDCPACGASPLAGTPAATRVERAAPAVAFGALAVVGFAVLDEPEIADLSDVRVLEAISTVPGASCRSITVREPMAEPVRNPGVQTVTCADGERYRIELAVDAALRVMPHR